MVKIKFCQQINLSVFHYFFVLLKSVEVVLWNKTDLVQPLYGRYIHPHLQTRRHKYTQTHLLTLTNTTTHPHTKQTHILKDENSQGVP